MNFMTDCSLKIGGARLMHDPFTKLLGARPPYWAPGSTPPTVTAHCT